MDTKKQLELYRYHYCESRKIFYELIKNFEWREELFETVIKLINRAIDPENEDYTTPMTEAERIINSRIAQRQQEEDNADN